MISLAGFSWLSNFIDKKVGERVREGLESYRQDMKDYVDLFNCRVHTYLGYMAWHDKRIDEAIRITETALQFTVDPNSEWLAHVKSNLAFYYAQAGRKDLKTKAIEYAQFAISRLPAFPHRINWAANEGYVRLKFAEGDEEKKAAVEVCRDVRNKYPGLASEMNEYLEEAGEREN